jgi:hypothetical protein
MVPAFRCLTFAVVAVLAANLLLAVPAITPLTTTPAPVYDPDGKQPARYSLPTIKLDRGGSLRVTGGDAYYEQAIVVWRVDEKAAIVQVGQVNRGSNAKGRPEGDGGGRPQSLDLKAAGTYYFQCWHKVEDPNKHISEVGWKASYETLTGDHATGYTLSCDDANRDGTPGGDFDRDDIIAEIQPTR